MYIFGLFLLLEALDFGCNVFGLFSVRLVLFAESLEHGSLYLELLDELWHLIELSNFDFDLIILRMIYKINFLIV